MEDSMRKVILTVLALVFFSAPSFGQSYLTAKVEMLDQQQQVLCPKQRNPSVCQADFTTTKNLVASFKDTLQTIVFRQRLKQISSTEAKQALKQHVDDIQTRISSLNQKYN
jgi:flagellar biosynthesis/type III secretory pathway chaperone